jgi:hypothetical protein
MYADMPMSLARIFFYSLAPEITSVGDKCDSKTISHVHPDALD